MRCSLLAVLLLIFQIVATATAAAPDREGVEFFEKHIRPVLVENCYKCHSSQAKKVKGGLVLDTRADIRKGGETGPAVVPGNVKGSLLIKALNHDEFEMPPDRKLPEDVITSFRRWVEMGAPDPREGSAIVQRAIDLEEGRRFWCFQPVSDASVPQVSDAWPRTDVDRFVFRKLKEQGLSPVGDADRVALLRRAYFDLIGLAPTPVAIQTFLDDRSESAFENVVDRLLRSPRFGEHWGRHWLDVVRYAESNGNTRNATFPNAWRYRDYVIDALNQDTPYDRFITEQIAGDLLPYSADEERNRNMIATGLLALGSKPVIRGKKGGFVPDIVSDQIEVTTRAMLGLTVACARCHDHKFDPIPTTDYYALAGIFASSETLYGGGKNSMGGAPATALHVLLSKDAAGDQSFKAWKENVADLQRRQREVSQQLKKLRPKKNRNKDKSAQSAAADPDAKKKIAELTGRLREISTELKRVQKQSPKAPPSAMGVREANTVRELPIYVRGESPKGSPIARGFVSVAIADGKLELPADQSGRLELAQWVASPQNPLTARVIVNRIWLKIFGEGIVRTPDNFGFNGDRPSHPELLDWLANRFVQEGWSIKEMVRLLMLSRTYALSSDQHAQNYESDPDNVYLWRHSARRLPAEAIRDSILAASGQLDLTRPEGSVVSSYGARLIQDSFTPETIHKPSNHRSVYLPILRNGLPEMLEVFDFADPSLVVGRRNVTTVPAQDLYLLNSPFAVEQSQHFARLLLEERTDDESRLELAYLRAIARRPSDAERDRMLRSLRRFETETKEGDGSGEVSAWATLCQILFVAAEFRHTY